MRYDATVVGALVTVPVDHPSFVAGNDFADGIDYLEPNDTVVVWWEGKGSIPDPITEVQIVGKRDGSVTLRFASKDDAARFSDWLASGIRLSIPLRHREGLVPEFKQGFAHGRSVEEQ